MPEAVIRTIPYEILIRFDDDGILKGAHYIERRIVTLDGEILKDEPGNAVPVSLAPDDTGKPVLSDILGTAMTAALAANDELRDRAEKLEADLQAANEVALKSVSAVSSDRLQKITEAVAEKRTEEAVKAKA